MSDRIFYQREPFVHDNPRLRTPQIEAYIKLQDFFNSESNEREVGIVLPVGCGKSGCIALAPFAKKSNRTLVVAPGVKIADQLRDDFNPSIPDNFYIKTQSITTPPFPEPVEIRGTKTNRADLDLADVIITNIQQLQGDNNRWLEQLPSDYIDLILFDEGHHSIAATWDNLKSKFPDATIINFSATPLRADGLQMAGRILYSYSVARAIQAGYVKRLMAIVLNPTTLRYVRREDGNEITVPLDEVRRLGEVDAEFRRAIVTSEETLNTIVDASIGELYRKRKLSGENKLKIIASALNHQHCIQIVEAYRARSLKAEFVHSNESPTINDKIMSKLDNHEIDVIVQVRKLGEGFDHPYLSIAAVFSIFSNLSPFIQFVGRIMRVIVQNDPTHILNHGTVVFHAGANVASRWSDFRTFSEADQSFFDQLLPVKVVDYEQGGSTTYEPNVEEIIFEVKGQSNIEIETIPLLESDYEAYQAILTLKQKGYSAEDISEFMKHVPVPTTKVKKRQASRLSLDDTVKNTVGRILKERGYTNVGYELDQKFLKRSNFVVLKSAIDRGIYLAVGKSAKQRHDFTQEDLDKIKKEFSSLVENAIKEVFDGKD